MFSWGRISSAFAQRGNVIVTVFLALGIVGAIGATSMGIIKGPMTGMSSVSQRTLAENDIASLTALLSEAAMKKASEADCDADGHVEPIPYKTAGALPAPTGGGLVPDTVMATKTDPWKTSYAYCAWDHGTLVLNAACGGAGANRLAGGSSSVSAVIAVVSAGPDRIFQTSCVAWVNDTTSVVNKPATSDDIVKFLPYGQFTLPMSGDTKLKEMPDEACTPQSIGIMRLEMGIVQSCTDTGWEEVGTSAQADTNFVPVTNAALGSQHTSNEITFTGFLNTKTIAVTGSATLLVNGVVRAAPATIVSGDKVSLRANAAATPDVPNTYTVSVSGIQRSWTVRTRDFYPASLSISPASVSEMNVQGPAEPSTGDLVGFVVTNIGETITEEMQASVLSNPDNFEFSGIGDGCAGEDLLPGETCPIQVRPVATSAHDQSTISGSLSVTDGAVSATATPLTGFAKGWTCTSPWGGPRINHTDSITAYNIEGAGICNGTCTSQSRLCTEDDLGGDDAYEYQTCNPLAACTYSWNSTAWSACSLACGGGERTRTVTCLRNDGTTVLDAECELREATIGPKPATSEPCNAQSCEIVKYIAATTTHVVLQNLFTAGEWSSTTPKRVVINSGVIVGSTSAATPALRTGTAWGGTLTLDNNGSIQGAGGQPNSGVGGTAILANASGLTLRNYGTIYGGGGAGGVGGTGGQGVVTGSYNHVEGPYYSDWSYGYFMNNGLPGGGKVYWAGVHINNTQSPFWYGGWYYMPGASRPVIPSNIWPTEISRQQTQTSYTYYNGGAGGTGGRGRGYDGANAGGSAGAAGGTNAGAGGTGGTGGSWGAAGATGNTGASGNNGGGAGGGTGGAAGYALQNSGYITISVTGTIAGRT